MHVSNRTIVVKTLFNADEFIEFERHCRDSDLSHSRAIRDLVKHWLHRSSTGLRRERPRMGLNVAMFPGRRGGAPMPLRL